MVEWQSRTTVRGSELTKEEKEEVGTELIYTQTLLGRVTPLSVLKRDGTSLWWVNGYCDFTIQEKNFTSGCFPIGRLSFFS